MSSISSISPAALRQRIGAIDGKRSLLGEPWDRVVVISVFGSLAAIAWLALWYFASSPYVHFFHIHSAHQGTPGFHPGNFTMATLFVCGWLLMVIAMMLPTSLPLLVVFNTICRKRENRALLVSLVAVGYLVAWLAFGVLAYGAVIVLVRTWQRSHWLQQHPWAVGSAILTMAGLYQFSPLKYRCLEKCRSPFSYVASRWHGGRPRSEAFTIGVSHGVFCVGCCWALMLLMIPVGAGSLGWMLLLGLVMATEKNLRIGRHIGKPVGAALLASALLIAL